MTEQTPKIIRTSVLSNVTEVHLYDETIDHVKSNHPEVQIDLPSIATSVENAIVNPTHVEESYNNSYVFVDGLTTNSSGDPLRVPVKLVSGTSARVKTVFFGTAAPKPIIWRRDE